MSGNLCQNWLDGVVAWCVIIRSNGVNIMYSIGGEIGVFNWFFADNCWFRMHKGCLGYDYLNEFWCIRDVWHKLCSGYDYLIILAIAEVVVDGFAGSKGEHIERIYIEECLNSYSYSDDDDDDDIAIQGGRCHEYYRKFKARVRGQYLTPQISYTLNLVFRYNDVSNVNSHDPLRYKWFSLNEKGEHCRVISIEDCLIPNEDSTPQYQSHGYSRSPTAASAENNVNSSKVLVLGGTGRVGGSTTLALSKLKPDLRLVIAGRADIQLALSPIPTPIGGGRANASERRNPNSPGLFNGVSSHPKDAADLIDGGGNPDMNNGISRYSINSPQMMSGQHGNVNLPPLFETDAATFAMAYPGMDSRFGIDSPNMSRLGSQMTGNALQASYMDPMYLQYLRSTEYATTAAQLAALNDPTIDRNNYL
ncbi:pumilio homolog 2-like protein, partial [Tanacetum coccineum]